MSVVTRITIADYERLIAEGAFAGGLRRQRIELIEGELREMSPIGPPHEMVVALLTEWSIENRQKEKVLVWVQCSIFLPARVSAPEPDLAWIVRKDYASNHPTGPDVYLIIEVADSSLAYDCGEKADQYASAGIADYWVVNIPDSCVEVYRQPAEGKYQSHQVFKSGDEVHPLAFPNVALSVSNLFPVAN